MPGKLNDPKSVAAGAIFVAVGISAVVISQNYQMGTALHMGPGYFPALVGVLLAALGLGAIVSGLASKVHDPIPASKLEPLLLILAGIFSFAFLVERAGLLVAAASLIFFACLRRLLTNPFEILLVYLVLTGFAAVVFVRWLGIDIRLFWWSA
ncbi:MAG TPA: tripartite tricarboxylate transporter TctB family protein [Acetobacteraceae bacterium]|jgi:hypothetical protein|nr:tripartite tricarboxylate transporter TctB family protein [Acetobacteraceae bacterium]